MQVIDFEKVIEHQDVSGVVKFAALLVKARKTVKLADFIRMISIEDLTLLKAFSNVITTGNTIALINLMSLSEILAFGEGVVHFDDSESSVSFLMVVHAIILEDLKRQNLIDIDYDLLNFESTPDTVIASITDKGEEYGIENPNQYP